MTINPFEALRHALFSVFRNMGAAFSISWPWLIVIALIFVGLGVLQFQAGPGTEGDALPGNVGALVLGVLIGFAIYLTAFGSIAVNWHRYILLDEPPRGAARLRVDGHVLRYVWRLFLAGLITLGIIAVPFMIAAFVFKQSLLMGEDIDLTTGTWLEIVARFALQGVATAIAGAIFFRSSLALPAAALGRYEVGIGESWRRTQGNFLPLVVIAAGSWLLQIAVQIVMLAASTLAAQYESAVGLSAIIAVGVVLTWYVTFFGITLFTSLYGFFIEHRTL